MRITYIFDLGGVLIQLDVQRCFLAFERLMGEDNMRAILGMDSRGEGVKAVSVASKQLMADFERGMISPETVLTQVQGYCHPGTTKDEILEAWMSMLDELPEERLAFVDSLRSKGHPVYLLSNGNDLHYDFINRKYGLESHFDGFFLSQKMHMAKPEPEIFEAVQKEIGNPENVIFIDDLQANRLAAEQTVHWKTFESIDALRQNIKKF
jgi:putative hydrolase of the HAD superfamily